MRHDPAEHEPVGPLTLPKRMMTDAWPLNQPVLGLPPDNRTLFTNSAGTVKGQVDTAVRKVYGPAHINIDASMHVEVVDSLKTPGIVVNVRILQKWGSDNATRVPIKGAELEYGTDRHGLVYDTATAILHELQNVRIVKGEYQADFYIGWPIHTMRVLPRGQTSADVAGLPIVPLLLRYEEIAAGPLTHALRVTFGQNRSNSNGGFFCPPASHAWGTQAGSVPYMGMRLRLRPDFPMSGLSPINQHLVKTYQTYGLVNADNGATGYVQAAVDSRWDFNDLALLSSRVTIADFTVVNSGPVIDSAGTSAFTH